MKLFLLVVGFTLLMEGIMPFFLPETYRKMIRQIATTKPTTLRQVGLAAILVGLIILYVAKELL
ncbi:MAG: DUF2065 domain-containing protein [Acidobacteria bacterium]|nr:MAG: DUF2065 domain-containing protein [Acidobacteriota bacterium]